MDYPNNIPFTYTDFIKSSLFLEMPIFYRNYKLLMLFLIRTGKCHSCVKWYGKKSIEEVFG